MFHFRHSPFYSHLKSKIDILTKVTSLRTNLNIDGVPVDSRSHTHPSHSQTSYLLPFLKTVHDLPVSFGGSDHVTLIGHVRTGMGYQNEFQNENYEWRRRS